MVGADQPESSGMDRHQLDLDRAAGLNHDCLAILRQEAWITHDRIGEELWRGEFVQVVAVILQQQSVRNAVLERQLVRYKGSSTISM